MAGIFGKLYRKRLEGKVSNKHKKAYDRALAITEQRLRDSKKAKQKKHRVCTGCGRPVYGEHTKVKAKQGRPDMIAVEIALDRAEKKLRDYRSGVFEKLRNAIENVNVRLDEHVDGVEREDVPGLELELIEFMGMYDRHQWVMLVGKYDAFAKAVDNVGDFYPGRLNAADLLDEILSHQTGELVRERMAD